MKKELIFKEIETANADTLEHIAQKLFDLMQGAMKDNAATLEAYKKNRTPKTRAEYFESVQRLAGIMDTFDALGADLSAVMEAAQL